MSLSSLTKRSATSCVHAITPAQFRRASPGPMSCVSLHAAACWCKRVAQFRRVRFGPCLSGCVGPVAPCPHGARCAPPHVSPMRWSRTVVRRTSVCRTFVRVGEREEESGGWPSPPTPPYGLGVPSLWKGLSGGLVCLWSQRGGEVRSVSSGVFAQFRRGCLGPCVSLSGGRLLHRFRSGALCGVPLPVPYP